jgi:prevent-host-death family protein
MSEVIPQRELRNNVSSVLRRVEAGETFRVTVHGREVAQLGPVTERRRFISRERLLASLAGTLSAEGAKSFQADIDEVLTQTVDEL